MDTLLKDLRYGVRVLIKSPGFAAVAVIALALGIGANTAIFSLVDSLLLRPLNFKDLDRIVAVSETDPTSFNLYTVAPADFADWRKQATSFEYIAAQEWQAANLTGAGEPLRVHAFRVSPSLFQVVGVEAAIGRTFLNEEEQPGRDQVALLGHKIWERQFGSNPNILGTTIALDGRSYEVVGVMPKGFDFPKPAEIWLPLPMTNDLISQRKSQYLSVIARLKPGVTLDQAGAEMQAIAGRLEQLYPQTNTDRGTDVGLLRDKITGPFTPMFVWTLMGAVAFVLLIACVNVANMQLARATSRYKEVAIRTAMGATRWRILRQLLTESVLLSLVGGLLGLLLAFWFVDMMKGSIPPDVTRFIPGWEGFDINARALGFTMAVTLLTGTAFGLAPALQVSKPDMNESLKEGARGSSAGSGRHRLRSLLVVAEIALALVLLVGSGLMVTGFARLADNQKEGFTPENVLTMKVTLTDSQYPEDHKVTDFYKQAVAQMQTVPGVVSACAVSNLPASDNWFTRNFSIEGRPDPPPGGSGTANFQLISPTYFQTMRIPLAGGREFTEGDGRDAPPVAIISEEMARRYWPDEDPLGKRVKLGAHDSEARWFSIVGVAGDVRRFMFDRELQPTLYFPQEQSPTRGMYFALRVTGDPLSAAAAARARVLSVDPNLPVYEIKPMEKVIADQMSGITLSAALMGILGLMALIYCARGKMKVFPQVQNIFGVRRNRRRFGCDIGFSRGESG